MLKSIFSIVPWDYFAERAAYRVNASISRVFARAILITEDMPIFQETLGGVQRFTFFQAHECRKRAEEIAQRRWGWEPENNEPKQYAAEPTHPRGPESAPS